MRRLLRRWYRHLTSAHDRPGCQHCPRLLTVCPACRGDWHAGCTTCRIGLLCTTHDRFWSVT